MEKMVMEGSIAPLGYESIGDRISRLRKEAASTNKPKQRPVYQPSYQKLDRSMELEPSQKQNKYRIESLLARTNTQSLNLTSPRKFGITKRPHYRFPTEDDSEAVSKILTNSGGTSRMPGKICKNVNRPALNQNTQGLRLGSRYA